MNARDPAPPKKHARAAAQRERILAAAQKCFIEHGFHAASMAGISATAGMSPGLMYRYFPSKNAIVLAIIERQLQETRAKVAELHATTDIAANLARAFENWRTGEPDVLSVQLFLGITAEAARDPQIAEALRASDRLTREDLKSWLGRGRAEGGRGVGKEIVELRVVLMQCLIEGLAIRSVRQPDLDIDKLTPALREVFEQLMAP